MYVCVCVGGGGAVTLTSTNVVIVIAAVFVLVTGFVTVAGPTGEVRLVTAGLTGAVVDFPVL